MDLTDINRRYDKTKGAKGLLLGDTEWLLKECNRLTALCDEYRGERDRLQAIVTALEEGCHSCQHPKRVTELTCQKNALQQVVAERDTDIARLRSEKHLLKLDFEANADETIALRQRHESLWREKTALESALTRTRAEAFEEAAEIASDTLYNTVNWGCDGDCNSPEIVAKAIRARGGGCPLLCTENTRGARTFYL